MQHKGKGWKKVAEQMADRTDVQCLHRWQKVLNPELVKGPWSKEVRTTPTAHVEIMKELIVITKKKTHTNGFFVYLSTFRKTISC